MSSSTFFIASLASVFIVVLCVRLFYSRKMEDFFLLNDCLRISNGTSVYVYCPISEKKFKDVWHLFAIALRAGYRPINKEEAVLFRKAGGVVGKNPIWGHDHGGFIRLTPEKVKGHGAAIEVEAVPFKITKDTHIAFVRDHSVFSNAPAKSAPCIVSAPSSR